MGRTLGEDMREAFYANVLDTSAFGELVTYWPAAGGPGRTVTAKITHEQRPDTEEHVRSEVERIVVTVGRQETHAKGGVATPRVRDTLERAGDEGLGLGRFAFTGEVLQGPAHSWRLVFSRPKARRIGTEQRQQ